MSNAYITVQFGADSQRLEEIEETVGEVVTEVDVGYKDMWFEGSTLWVDLSDGSYSVEQLETIKSNVISWAAALDIHTGGVEEVNIVIK